VARERASRTCGVRWFAVVSTRDIAGKALRVLRREGLPGLAERTVRTASRRLAWGEPLHLHPDDIVDPERLVPAPTGPVRRIGSPLEIGWVMSVPGRDSGGHATLFRFVEALERAGHRCTIFLYDCTDASAKQHEPLIRELWPRVRARVRAVREGLPPLDAYVATAWETAHVLARRHDVPGRRFYLVQDYEPYFYPRGSAYQLAEETYRFGFHPITVGHTLAEELRQHFGSESTVAEFGCDDATYHAEADAAGGDVVFYSRPSTPRRGFELGVVALERFHRQRPEVTIHTFGAPTRRLTFPAEVHTRLAPVELNALYQRCSAGLALSFTNISLIPYELLAAGVIPVLNDWAGTRAFLDGNPCVEWARPTPDALAAALVRACDRRTELPASRISASVADVSWRPAERTVVAAFERACAGG
jgi:O-antigen biosynthesis protein